MGAVMKNRLLALAILLGAVIASAPALAASLSAWEWLTLRQIAKEYSLTDEQTWLLAAIRLHENGRPGLEFGIGGPMNSGHPAHRYRDGIRSFRVQCAWAAGTVRRRHHGDLNAFARRYNPPNADKWAKSVANIIARLKRQHHGVLP